MLQGTVRWFNRTRELGMIAGDDGQDYVIRPGKLEDVIPLEEGMRVQFTPEGSAARRAASTVQIIYRKISAA